jgi:hypothetical protein
LEDRRRFEKFVEDSYANILTRLENCERRQGNDNGIWNGQEQRSALFSDRQVEWLEKFHEKQNKIIVGDAALRLIGVAIGAFFTGVIASALAFFGIKH